MWGSEQIYAKYLKHSKSLQTFKIKKKNLLSVILKIIFMCDMKKELKLSGLGKMEWSEVKENML